MKSVKVYLYVSARPEPNDPQYVCVSHMKIRWGRHRQNTHLPNSPAGALKFAPTSTVSPSKTTAARDAEWTSTSSASDRGGDRCSWLLYRLKQQSAQDCVRGEHDFSGCTECRLSKNHGHWAQDCPEARKADWNERNGEQERRGRVTGIQQATKREVKIYWHTHTTRSHTLIQIRLSAMKKCLQTLYVWLLKYWIMLSAMKTCLQPLCVTAEVLNNVSWLMNVWECTKV